jgi:hypothetical protein
MFYVITKNHYKELQESEYVLPLLQKIKNLKTRTTEEITTQECEFTNYIGIDNLYEKIYNLYQCSHKNKLEAFIFGIAENSGFGKNDGEHTTETDQWNKKEILKTIIENIQYYIYRVNPREKITYEIKKSYRNIRFEYEKKRLEMIHYIDNLIYEIEYLINAIMLYFLFLCKMCMLVYLFLRKKILE